VTLDAIDGSLLPWWEVEPRHPWSALLIGNGLSINVWPQFAYGSLFDHARNGNLTEADRALFHGTRNFERVLSDLMTAMRVNRALGVDAGHILERYRSIQVALGRAIREVHVWQARIPDETLAAIRATLLGYEWLFTTSYDLLLYWAMKGPKNWKPFFDAFLPNDDGRCAFDPARTEVYAHQTPVYFLHGALHLVVGREDITWKLQRTGLKGLLDQFGHPIDGDPEARPLLVTEGSAREKLRAIEGNPYLAHALAQLEAVDVPLVVFGSSLAPQDSHLVDALNEHPSRPVAISMLPGPRREIAARKAELVGRLETDELLFFDARTHPLGAPALTVLPSSRPRPRVRSSSNRS
jgi:Domain of unknown function (DUF4917)